MSGDRPIQTSQSTLTKQPAATGAAVNDGRIAWIDMARGACVLAVVLTHVCYRLVFPLAGPETGRPLYTLWDRLNYEVLGHLRMPLLLFLSGWLAGSKIRSGVRDPRTRLSVVTNSYLYVLWTLIYVALELAVPRPDGVMIASTVQSWAQLPRELAAPQDGPLWFVYGLAILVTILALARRLPTGLVLGILFVVGWLEEYRDNDTSPAWTGVPHLGFYFALGAVLGPHVVRIISSRLVVAGGVVAFVAGVVLIGGKVLPRPEIYLANTCMRLGAVICLMAAARALSRWRFFRAPASWVGRRTLSIYVLHWPVIGLLGLALVAPREGLAAWEQSDITVVWSSLALAAGVAVVCLGFETIARRIRLGFLFDPPRAVRRLAGAARAGGSRA